jgi:hypothetical protein
MHPELPRFRLFVLGLVFAACSGGSSGGGGDPEPPTQSNDAPVLTAPSELSGGPVQFSYVLPTTGTQSLAFTATDADGDPLLWQVAVSASGASSAGLSFASPALGATFSLDLAVIADPTIVEINVLVEDARGAAAAIDILLIRSGAPTVTGVSRSSAFASAPQGVTITGTALSLGNTVSTLASFGGVVAGDIVVVDEATLTCSTPQGGILGPTTVGVTNAYGSALAPGGSFTMYEYPLNLFAADVASDGGAGAQLAVANQGASMHMAWVEAGALQYRHSEDAGATWSVAVALSGAEVPSDPQIAVDDQEVTVVWQGDSDSVLARSSSDGGVTFVASAVLNPLAAGAPVSRPRVVASGGRKYCAWLEGNPALGQRRVQVATSGGGEFWRPAVAVSDQGANQSLHDLVCDGSICWVAYVDSPMGLDEGVYTSRSVDTGVIWSAGARRSQISTGITAIRACTDGPSSYLGWVRDGELEYMASQNTGFGWPTQATLFRSNDLGAITEPQLVCEGDQLFAIYVAGGNNVACSRIGGIGASPQNVTVSDVVESVREPQIAVHGNYVYVSYSSGLIGGGTGSARIRYATSVDLGVTFTAPSGLGDGAAAQDQVRMMTDEARVWMGWLDYRGANAALFENRTEQ